MHAPRCRAAYMHTAYIHAAYALWSSLQQIHHRIPYHRITFMSCHDYVQAIQEQMRAELAGADLEQFVVRGAAEDFEAAVGAGGPAALRSGGMLSVKAGAPRPKAPEVRVT